MSNINIKKTKIVEGEEVARCNHCKKSYTYSVRFHYEERPKKIEGKLVIPLELISIKTYDLAPPMICLDCREFPLCKDCEIILCNWKRHFSSHTATQDARYCTDCYEWKVRVIPRK